MGSPTTLPQMVKEEIKYRAVNQSKTDGVEIGSRKHRQLKFFGVDKKYRFHSTYSKKKPRVRCKAVKSKESSGCGSNLAAVNAFLNTYGGVGGASVANQRATPHAATMGHAAAGFGLYNSLNDQTSLGNIRDSRFSQQCQASALMRHALNLSGD